MKRELLAIAATTTAAAATLLLGTGPATADTVCSPAPGEDSYLQCTGPAGTTYVWTPVGAKPDTFPQLHPAAQSRMLTSGTVLRDRPELEGRVVSGPGTEFVPIVYLADWVAVGGDTVTVQTCTTDLWALMKDPATGALGWAPQAAIKPYCLQKSP